MVGIAGVSCVPKSVGRRLDLIYTGLELQKPVLAIVVGHDRTCDAGCDLGRRNGRTNDRKAVRIGDPAADRHIIEVLCREKNRAHHQDQTEPKNKRRKTS